MKKKINKFLLAIGLAGATFAVAGCTANFCTNVEKGRIAFAIEPGVSAYYDATDYAAEIANNPLKETDLHYTIGAIHQVVRIADGQYSKSVQLNTIISSAKSSGISAPTTEYFVAFDKNLLLNVASAAGLDLNSTSLKTSEVNAALKKYGAIKFYSSNTDDLWANYKAANDKLRSDLGFEKAATIDFENAYMSAMNQVIDTFRSCITTYDEVEYGNYGTQNISVKLDKVTWGEAWGKGGHVIEGLIVYPVAWLVDTFARIFAGGSNVTAAHIAQQYQTGVPQLLSLILVTVFVRLFIFLVTIKSTLSQKKMTDLQPELAKIQAKYPNSNTNQSQKQRLAEEQMRLYKKNHVNPLSQILVLIIQFPVFIGVWGAMQGSAVLSTGQVLGLHLSDSIWTTLKAGPSGNAGWWTAFVLIILMSVSQFFSMKVPQWIQKAKTKKVARLGKNPAQKSQNRTANIISYVMLVMIIVMGFTLPAAMGVYWFIGAIVSLLQTVLTNYVFVGKKNKK